MNKRVTRAGRPCMLQGARTERHSRCVMADLRHRTWSLTEGEKKHDTKKKDDTWSWSLGLPSIHNTWLILITAVSHMGKPWISRSMGFHPLSAREKKIQNAYRDKSADARTEMFRIQSWLITTHRSLVLVLHAVYAAIVSQNHRRSFSLFLFHR
jgi:hypothetical protein